MFTNDLPIITKAPQTFTNINIQPPIRRLFLPFTFQLIWTLFTTGVGLRTIHKDFLHSCRRWTTSCFSWSFLYTLQPQHRQNPDSNSEQYSQRKPSCQQPGPMSSTLQWGSRSPTCHLHFNTDKTHAVTPLD